MKVGVIVDNEYFNDIRVVREVEILKKKYEVYILCFDFGSQINSSDPQVNRIRIQRKLKDFLFGMMVRLPFYNWFWTHWINAFINRFKLDVLHVHDLYMAKSAGKAAKKHEIPMILDLHENYPVAVNSYNWTNSKIKGWLSAADKWFELEAEYLKYADRIIVLSDYFKHQLASKFDFLQLSEIFEFENVVDFKFFDSLKKANIDFSFGGTVFFYFGGVAERRGIFETLDVIESLGRDSDNFHLLIIGPVDNADKELFLKRIENPLIKGLITYIPWIDVSLLPSYMEKVDICLAPFVKNEQHDSGVANKIYQYMYFGKPVVASNCYSQEKLINEANCGLIFEDKRQFSESLIKLISNPSLSEHLGENGKSFLNEKFRGESYANKLFKVYNSLSPKE